MATEGLSVEMCEGAAHLAMPVSAQVWRFDWAGSAQTWLG